MLTLITSYPKSGNTWMRRFLCCYAIGRRVHLSELPTICPLIYSPDILKGDLGFEPDFEADIPYLRARPEMYRRYHALTYGGKSRVYLKTHSANVEVNGIRQNIDECVSRYVYLVRHPNDVIPSYAHHLGLSVEETWERMKMDTFMTRRDDETPCWELVSSWERHTRSWLEIADSPKLLLVRYEDMKRRPISTFRRVLEHLALPLDEEMFLKALVWSDFETMRDEEKGMEDGYCESTNRGPFFRRGEVGDGGSAVPRAIQDEVRARFPDLLRVLGYG